MKGQAIKMDGVVRGGFVDHGLHVITSVPFALPSSSSWVLELWACATTPNLSLPFVTLSSGSDFPLQYCLLLSDVGKAEVLCRYANQFLHSWFLWNTFQGKNQVDNLSLRAYSFMHVNLISMYGMIVFLIENHCSDIYWIIPLTALPSSLYLMLSCLWSRSQSCLFLGYLLSSISLQHCSKVISSCFTVHFNGKTFLFQLFLSYLSICFSRQLA